MANAKDDNEIRGLTNLLQNYSPSSKREIDEMHKPTRYEVKLYAAVDLKLANGGTKKKAIDCSEYLYYVELVLDYDESVFPFINVGMKVPKRVLYALQEDIDSLLFMISIKRVEYDEPDLERKDEWSYIKNMVCKPYNFQKKLIEPPDLPKEVTNASLKDDVNEKEGTNEEELNESNPQHDLNFQLFKLEHLTFNKTLNPTVFSGCTIADAILRLINKNTTEVVDTKFFVGPIDNKDVYEQIIIPPYNLVQSINYLQEEYGVFKNGLRFFFDFKFGYIVDAFAEPVKNGLNRVGKPLPKTVIELYSDRDDDKGIAEGLDGKNLFYYANDITLYIVRTTQIPGVSSNPQVSKELNGEIAKFGSTSEEKYRVICRDLLFDTKQNARKTKENCFWNTNDVEYNETEFMIDMSKMFGYVKLTFPNTYIDAFEPNKTITLIDMTGHSTYSEIQGRYKMSKFRVFIPYKKSSPSTATSVVELKKII